MMKNDNRNDRRTSGPAKGTEKTKATGKANAAGKTKVPAGKENRVPVGPVSYTHLTLPTN